MCEIRSKCVQWSKKTFKELLLDNSDINQELKIITLSCFNSLHISERKVNGYASEGLPKTNEGNTGVKINYSKVFYDLLEDQKFNPVVYLAELVRIFIESSADKNKLVGFIARGLRTLTSLMREPDFAEKLEVALKIKDPNANTDFNHTQDAKDHTDVLANFEGKTYRIWLFQFSKNGLPHDIERITGRRGELPNGNHVLCPLKTEIAKQYDQLQKNYNKKIFTLNKKRLELENCSVRAVKRKEQLNSQIKELSSQIQYLNDEITKAKPFILAELDIVKGWYFYSTQHINRVAQAIQNNIEAYKYNHVVEILLTPENFLSQTRIVIKN